MLALAVQAFVLFHPEDVYLGSFPEGWAPGSASRCFAFLKLEHRSPTLHKQSKITKTFS